jgi:hypothetical protein
MKLSKGNCILIITIMAALLVLIAVSCLAGIVLSNLAQGFALDNPVLQHMEKPVLLMGLSLIGIFIINLVLGEILLVRIIKNSIFAESSVHILRLMSWLFIAGFFILIALGIYTEMNVHHSITQIYVVLFAIVYLTAGLIFRLISNLIQTASFFKQEVDMTV